MALSLRFGFFALAALPLLGACGSSDEGGVGGGSTEPPPQVSPMLESASAQARLDAISERFQSTADAVARPVIGEGVATFERDIATGVVRATVGPDARLGVVHAARVGLPAHASGAVELACDDAPVSVKFALRGASEAPAELASGRVVYRGALDGSDVVHRVTADGTEDFVVFEERPAREELIYDVEVSRTSGLRLVGNTLEFLDADGVPRLRVAPPYVIDAEGERHDAHLAVHGCAVDTDPSAPWGREPVAPGSSECEVRVGWEGVSYPLVVDPNWVGTGWLVTSRFNHTETLLGTNRVLVTGGSNVGIASAELYDEGTGTWASTGSLLAARTGHSATLLGSGKVLVAGGNDSVGTLSSAELYDPGAGTFTATGAMTSGRKGHTATRLTAGKVLLVGGENGSSTLSTAELYDPAGTFTATGSMSTIRRGHTATLLGSGKVLVAAGRTPSAYLASAELYDPGMGTFAATGSLTVPRATYTATLLGTGKVLMAGGFGTGTATLSSADLYDPVAATFAATGAMPGPRVYHTATLLGSGKVLLTGGYFGVTLSSATLYDPAAGTFVATGSMIAARSSHSATLLSSGKVLVAGTQSTRATELYAVLAMGDACTIGGECASGFCADGVCCLTACDGVCEACTTAKKGGTNGVCDPMAINTDLDNECAQDPASSCQNPGVCSGMSACRPFYSAGTECASPACSAGTATSSTCNGAGTCSSATAPCAPYACGATSCQTSCTGDGQCASGSYCDAPECKLKKPSGEICAAGTECILGHCVDGVCCGTACGGPCEACSLAKKGSGLDGVCEPIDAGVDPDAECPDDGSGTCDRDGSCNGAGACRLYQLGASCGATACSGNNVTGLSCDGLGTCANSGTGVPCFPYTCAAGACTIPCATDAQCQAGNWCDQGTCTAKGDPGAYCASGNECVSTFCVDGVCCGTDCTSLCQACSAIKKGSGADGVCEPIDAGLDLDGDCPDDGTASCDRDGTCDGAGACRVYALGTECQVSTCANNAVTDHTCNGLGTCQSMAGPSCGQFLCTAGTCNTSCSTEAQCFSTAYCDANDLCAAKEAQGSPCTTSEECVSTHCVDGYCCNALCAGQCEACDAVGGEGACVPVSDAPHGARPACDPGTTEEPCAAASCDGTERTTCAGFVGSGVTCLEASCADGIAVFAESCDGDGSCPAPMTKVCEPYVCDGTVCADSCDADEDCAPGFTCDVATLKCTSGATCDDDHTLTAPNGTQVDCTPYRCFEARCRDTCESVDDCVEPNVCDPDGHCIVLDETDGGGEAGGCGCRAVGSKRDGDMPWLFGALLGLAAVSRRRRNLRD